MLKFKLPRNALTTKMLWKLVLFKLLKVFKIKVDFKKDPMNIDSKYI